MRGQVQNLSPFYLAAIFEFESKCTKASCKTCLDEPEEAGQPAFQGAPEVSSAQTGLALGRSRSTVTKIRNGCYLRKRRTTAVTKILAIEIGKIFFQPSSISWS